MKEKSISKLIKEAHKTAKSKGFWDDIEEKGPRIFACLVMLVVTELSESVEAARNANFRNRRHSASEELADAVIRIFDICAGYDIDLYKEIRKKMILNSRRKFKHGKRF